MFIFNVFTCYEGCHPGQWSSKWEVPPTEDLGHTGTFTEVLHNMRGIY
jgi:hypothetical protein